ncbi:MAG: radical SAM family heme chaperone HemW [Desulfomonilaceae bacterium]
MNLQKSYTPQSFPDDGGPVGAYIHIPFCLSRCNYCAFVSYPFDPRMEDPYVEAVIREINSARTSPVFSENPFPKFLDTIYIGGGTPSVFDPRNIKRLIDTTEKSFEPVKPLEITVEINPRTYTVDEFLKLREAGVNRISIGAQSLNEQELISMNRFHDGSDFRKIYDDARSAGFDNISVDLLVGYPGQTLDSCVRSLKGIVELGPEHLSVYMFELKSGSRIAKMIESNEVRIVSDDLMADMYETICGELTSSGFTQYEISNFCKPGMESKHNLKYWTDQMFLGFGAAAHGMIGSVRYSNLVNLDDYFEAVRCNRNAIESVLRLNPLTRFKDAMIMGLRKNLGVNLLEMDRRYSFDSHVYVKQTLNDLEDAELFFIENDIIRLTPKGRLLSNIVFSRFV